MILIRIVDLPKYGKQKIKIRTYWYIYDFSIVKNLVKFILAHNKALGAVLKICPFIFYSRIRDPE
jgi:hypothetical protein